MGKQLRKISRTNISKEGKKPYVPGKSRLGDSIMSGLASRALRRNLSKDTVTPFYPQYNGPLIDQSASSRKAASVN